MQSSTTTKTTEGYNYPNKPEVQATSKSRNDSTLAARDQRNHNTTYGAQSGAPNEGG